MWLLRINYELCKKAKLFDCTYLSGYYYIKTLHQKKVLFHCHISLDIYIKINLCVNKGYLFFKINFCLLPVYFLLNISIHKQRLLYIIIFDWLASRKKVKKKCIFFKKCHQKKTEYWWFWNWKFFFFKRFVCWICLDLFYYLPKCV